MMTLIANLQSSLMEWIYKIYMGLLVIAAPYRMALLILLLAILTPIIIKLTLYLLHQIIKLIIKVSDTLHLGIGKMGLNRRNQGKSPIIGTSLIDFVLSIIIQLGTKLNDVIIKRRNFAPKTKKKYKMIVILLMLGLPIWGIFSPTGALGSAWDNFEQKLIENHLKELGYDPSTYKSLASFSAEITKALEKGSESASKTVEKSYYITPKPDKKDGVFVRKGPDTTYPKEDVLPYGEKATYIKKTINKNGNTWFKVITERNKTGWVSANATNMHAN
jgi:hypothetical protein